MLVETYQKAATTLIENYITFDSYWSIGLGLFTLLSIGLSIYYYSLKSKTPNMWTDKDRYKGLKYAYYDFIPFSRVKLSLSFIISIGGVIGGYGTYLAFSNGSLLDKTLEVLFYFILLAIGVTGNVLSFKMNRFKHTLKNYHTSWIRKNYREILDNARRFFTNYAIAKIPENQDNLSFPFIYTMAVKDKNNKERDHLKEKKTDKYFDTWHIKGVFPGKEKSVLIYPKGQEWFRFDMEETLFNHYAAENNIKNKKIKAKSQNKDRLEAIEEKIDLPKLFEKLDFKTENFEEKVEIGKLKKFEKTKSKWLHLYCKDEQSFEEHFYDKVQNVEFSKKGLKLTFDNSSNIEIPTTAKGSDLENQALMEIRDKILEKRN
jgi:hypothetical protein